MRMGRAMIRKKNWQNKGSLGLKFQQFRFNSELCLLKGVVTNVIKSDLSVLVNDVSTNSMSTSPQFGSGQQQRLPLFQLVTPL